VKHQELGAYERNQTQPAVRGQRPAARAEKFRHENRNRRRRQNNSELQQVPRLLRHDSASFLAPMTEFRESNSWTSFRLILNIGYRNLAVFKGAGFLIPPFIFPTVRFQSVPSSRIDGRAWKKNPHPSQKP
jgi:hypothetical protein